MTRTGMSERMVLTIRNDDARNVLKEQPSESVDAIVTDVPYRTTQRGNADGMGGFWKDNLTNKGKIFQINEITPSEYLPDFYRVLKDGSHCYVMTNNLNLIEMLNEGVKAGFHFVKSLIWDKGAKICGTYYMGTYEYILLFRKGKDRPINDCSTPDILSVPMKKTKEDGDNLHNTEKPVELMRILIENATDRGECVMDPFMGIGSTGVASILTGRDFIGCEIDKRYFDIAERRLTNTKASTLEGWL